MPIYDNNGTTSTEIGKIYDNNNATSTQIGEVYDNNNTTSTLIYTATPPYLYLNGDQYTGDTGGWIGVTSGCYWYNQHNWYAGGTAVAPVFNASTVSLNTPYSQYRGSTIRTARAVDLTDITSLTAVYDTVGSGGDTTYISTAMMAAKATSGEITPAAGVHTTNLRPEAQNGSTMTLNCSALTGVYYIYIGSASGGGNYINMTLHNIRVTSK